MILMRMFIPQLIAVTALLLLTGCAVGPCYKQPAIDIPSHFGRLSDNHDTAERLLIRWWESFNDPDINWLIEESVDRNHDLRVAVARVLEARAFRSLAKSEYGPTLDARAAYSRSKLSGNNRPNYVYEELEFKPKTENIFETGFDSQWEIDLWGRIRRLNEMSKAEFLAAENSRREIMVMIIADVVREYIRLRSVQEQCALNRETICLHHNHVSVVEAHLLHGTTSGVTLARAKADLHAAESVLPILNAQIEEAIHRLSVLTGHNPMELDQRLAVIKPLPEPVDQIPSTIPSLVIRRRADVQAAEMELAAATARIGIATADLFPRFELTGRAGWESTRFSNFFENPSLAYSFGPSVQWTIWDWGKIRANIKAQGARQQSALARYEQTVLIALEEVETSLSRTVSHKDQFGKLVQAYNANAETFRILNLRKSRGLESSIALIEAERMLVRSRTDLAECHAELLYDVIRLYKAFGGGWEAFGEDNIDHYL